MNALNRRIARHVNVESPIADYLPCKTYVCETHGIAVTKITGFRFVYKADLQCLEAGFCPVSKPVRYRFIFGAEVLSQISKHSEVIDRAL